MEKKDVSQAKLRLRYSRNWKRSSEAIAKNRGAKRQTWKY